MTLGIYCGIAAGIVHIIGYVIYNWHSQNRPNIAAWSIWAFLALLNTSSYLVMSGDWVKSLLIIVNSCLCIFTLILALYRGKCEALDTWDQLALLMGIVTGFVWITWHSASYANVVLQVAIGLGFISLYRGVWRKPDSERALPWLIWCIGYSFNAGAVYVRRNGAWQEFAYPLSALVYHCMVAVLLSVRRWKIEVM